MALSNALRANNSGQNSKLRNLGPVDQKSFEGVASPPKQMSVQNKYD